MTVFYSPYQKANGDIKAIQNDLKQASAFKLAVLTVQYPHNVGEVLGIPNALKPINEETLVLKTDVSKLDLGNA